MSSKGSGGGGTTNTIETANPPAQVLAAYQTAQTAAQTAASAPLQQYGGPQVAGFTPDQLQAFQTVAGTAGAQQPYLNTASTDINNSTTPLWNGVQQFSPSAVQNYESPYTSNVLNTTMAAENNQDQQQQQALQGQAISSGAWGGDRSAVAQAQLAGQQDIANNATNAGIENTGYNTALGEFNTQQQAQLGANEANSYLNSQAGFGNINLAQNAVSIPIEQASAQAGTGAQEQALGQSVLNVPYEQFLQQQAYPFQTSQFETSAAEGLGPGQGSTGTASSTAPGASTASQVGGGLLGAGSLLGASGAFGDAGWLASLFAKGGRIHRDSGGNIPGFDPNNINLPNSIVPTVNAPGTKLLPLPQIKSPQTAQSSPLSGLSGISGLGSLAKLLGNSGSGSTAGMPGGLGNFAGSDALSSSAAGDGAASMATSDGADAAMSEDAASDFFKKGGSVPQFRNGRAIGGQVLPDVLSGIGDVVGAFFGDPGAGDQGVGVLSMLDNGETGSEGIMGRTMGSIEGQGSTDGGTGFSRGGRPHYDDGGTISPVTGAAPAPFDASGLQQNVYQKIQQLPMDKLQELQTRMPPTTPQGQMVQKAIRQKQFMPAGQQPQAGLSAPQAPQAGTQLQAPMQQQPQSGMAGGGRLHRDDGGDIPEPLAYPQMQDQEQQEIAAEPQAQDTSQAGLGASQAPAQSAKVSPWEALAAAGFGMMAGTSPQAGVNIGRGAMYGLQNLEEQKKQVAGENYQNSQVQNEAQKLAAQVGQYGKENEYKDKALQQQADLENQKLAQESSLKNQELSTMTPYQQAMVNARKQEVDNGKWLPVKDMYGNESFYNPQTKQYAAMPQQGNNSLAPSGSTRPSGSTMMSMPPSPQAIAALKANPDKASEFEAKYGVPAQQYLGQ